MTFSHRLLMVSFVLMAMTACTVRSQPAIKLEPLGEVIIPYNKPFQGTPIGGLSGLTYDNAANVFYVISDDRSELAPARFYTFDLYMNASGRLSKDGIEWLDTTFLKNAEGKPYRLNSIDPEGISITPDSLIYVSSEGGRATGEPPFVNAYRKDGTFVKSLRIPQAYWPAKAADRLIKGIRTNLAFESLTLSPDGQHLYAATENALLQDGPAADVDSMSPARIIEYSMPRGNVAHEYRYDVNKVFVEEGEKRGPFGVNGLSDLQAIDNRGHLLALDRNYVQSQGNRIGLYLITLAEATDISGIHDLHEANKSIQPVKKQIIAELSEFDITIDNYEGITLGPDLPGGGKLLLIVSDNNFSEAQQTVFAAFRFFYKKEQP